MVDITSDCEIAADDNNKRIKMVDITSDCEIAADDNNTKIIWGFRGSQF
jgi:hypothetical protein